MLMQASHTKYLTLQEVHSFEQYRNFIVQAKALGKTSGCFAELVASSHFRERMVLYAIDEAHNVGCWGCLHHGVPPFKLAWGRLGSKRT
jgi:hypothetical protein